MKPVQVGDIAPDFAVTDSAGTAVTLSQFRGQHAVVLFFYPRDNTAVCTQEACAFRDAYTDFTQAGAVVIGVSGSSDASHQSFAQTHGLPYHLIADEKGELRKLFGVPNTLFILPGRVTYVIDKSGVVRHVFNALLQGRQHVDEALKIVRELNAA
ncbi:MAG: peroxiredoxin [Planctomycetes bacterium]|nr:peroxiredoxin [Planctomycetota bacterium]